MKVIASQLTRTYSAKIETIEADLTKNEDLARVEHLLATNPVVYLLVNNAGNGKISSTVAMPDADAASTIALNSTALTTLTRAVLPALLSRNEGAIINISSVMALHSLSITSLYNIGLWEAYDSARSTLFGATQNGQPAPRYELGSHPSYSCIKAGAQFMSYRLYLAYKKIIDLSFEQHREASRQFTTPLPGVKI